MLLERYYDESLAQASYLIGCEAMREAIVIDPNVNETYEATLTAKRLRVRYVTETHIHADFLSGSRALAARHGALLLLSAHGGTDWSYRDGGREGVRLVKDGDSITVGRVRLDVMHVPGHTPEHICFLVTDTAASDRPLGIVSGDFVFVGDVGRPDLLEKAAKAKGTMDASARDLFRSLQRLAPMPDYLQIWPGHGAGSACGKSLGALPQSTLGYERLYNPALRHSTEDAFVAWVLAEQPEPPPYFARMKQLNRDGWSEAPDTAGKGWPAAAAVLAAISAGAQVVDPRPPRDFAKQHIAGTISIPESKSFPTYAGTVLDYDRRLILLTQNPVHGEQLRRQLSLIGFRPEFALLDVVQAVAKDSPHRMSSLPVVDAPQLAAHMESNGMRLLDVRGTSEWNGGHLPHAEHVYLGDLRARAGDLKRDEPIVVHCQTGARSSIAASLLMASGFTNVTDFPGGFAAWRKAGLPVET